MPLTDLEKRREYDRKRAKNPQRIKARKKYAIKRLHTLSGRRYQWIIQGIKSHDYYDIYDRFYSTTKCEVCNVKLEGKGSQKKCVDHHHLSGEFRNIICCKCNCERNKIDRKYNFVLLELHRYFKYNNIS
jgi:hypothetical protein